MNVLLIDNNPHLQKTLQYFLHPYAPSIYLIGSQDELPEKIDIIFLDSEHKNNEYISHLKNKEEKPPIVLISRDEKTLTELASEYPASLKKPIQYNQLQEIIHHLIPETRSFQASSYLKFYENSEKQEQPITLSQSESSKEDLKETPKEEPLKSIPLMSDKNAKTDKSNELQSKSSTIEKQQPAFDKKQAIVIPNDIKLVDEIDSTSLHNTNTFLKNISENMKKKSQASVKPIHTDADKNNITNMDIKAQQDSPQETSVNIKKETEESTGSQVLQSPQEDSLETLVNTEKEIEESTGSQVLQSPQETSDDLKQESNLEDLSIASDIPDIEKSQPISTPAHFDNEKWDTLSNKVVEIIDKHFQDKWETFINTQLKKEVKEMIHKEVTQIFKEQMKDILTTEGIQSIKKASEEISWKVIPELSKQIIQKEIKKLLNKPPVK